MPSGGSGQQRDRGLNMKRMVLLEKFQREMHLIAVSPYCCLWEHLIDGGDGGGGVGELRELLEVVNKLLMKNGLNEREIPSGNYPT